MIITKKHLPRRTILKGLAGISIGLPLLDSMIPAATAQNLTAAKPQLRTSFVYTPHGVILENWVPETTGTDYAMTPILNSLAPFRDKLQIISNLALNPNNHIGSGHATASATWLSSAIALEKQGADLEAGVTIDQMIAMHLGQDTPLPSIELGIEDAGNMIGACDGTSSCGYLNTTAWRGNTAPLPMEINPRIIFERMFGFGNSPEERSIRANTDKSLLDSITQAAGRLENQLGGADQSRMNDYLDNVREVERRIVNLEKRTSDQSVDLIDAPVEIPELYDDHVSLMFDLQVLALQTDTSRVTSFMMSRELNQRTYPQIGVRDQHHSISHHGNSPEKLAQHTAINTYHVQLLSDFVEKLHNIEDGDGTLLDHSMILFGSGMGDGNVHSQNPISNLLIGGGAGKLQSGRHISLPDDTPMGNLLLSMLDVAGIHLDKLGDSTGRLDLGQHA